MKRESIGRTFVVAAVLCVVCSIIVSVAAVGLRPLQLANKNDFKRKNILIAAGLYDEEKTDCTIGDSVHNGRIYGGRMLHGLINHVRLGPTGRRVVEIDALGRHVRLWPH